MQKSYSVSSVSRTVLLISIDKIFSLRMIVLVQINMFLILSCVQIFQINDYIIIAEDQANKTIVHFYKFIKRKVAVIN